MIIGELILRPGRGVLEVLILVAVSLLSPIRARGEVLRLIVELLLDEIRIDLIRVEGIVVAVLGEIRSAVDVRLCVSKHLSRHVRVFAVGGDGVVPLVLRKPLQCVDVVQIVLRRDVGGVLLNVVQSGIGDGRIQDTALSEVVERVSDSVVHRRPNRVAHRVQIVLRECAVFKSRQALVGGRHRAFVPVNVFGQVGVRFVR